MSPRSKAYAEKLTPQQDRYCVERAKGETQEAAYRAAYPKSKGKPETLRKEAKKLDRQLKVRQRIAALMDVANEAAIKELTVGKIDVMRELWDNAMKAKAAMPVMDREGNETGEWTAMFQASNKALELVGKEIGMFREQPETERDPLEDLTHDQIKALVKLANELVKVQPDERPGRDSGRHPRPVAKRAKRALN